ncbi:hypothetical protein L798_03386 [Zootermopsis nevadensis]|uniref:Uncharacterized protein n=1 Tax=Zootermopsis nevadensis TaxID=136037 RepID=A0A067RPW2_ZOONE|nr:hypothetical protein L798_03386 [Zootermopsis nevadensis]
MLYRLRHRQPVFRPRYLPFLEKCRLSRDAYPLLPFGCYNLCLKQFHTSFVGQEPSLRNVLTPKGT